MKKIHIMGLIIGFLALMLAPALINIPETHSIMACALVGFSVFSCATTPKRSCEDCITDELNKVVHVAFVKRGTAIPTIGTVASLLAAELAGSAYIIRNVSGGYDGGKGTFGKGLGKQLKRLNGKNHTLTFIDFAYVDNTQYWADLEAQASGYDLYFFTDTRVWIQINAYLNVEAQGTITDNNETFIEATIVVTWAKITNPLNYIADVDSLAICPLLFIGSGLHFSNLSGSTATIIPGDPDEIDLTANVSVANSRLATGVTLSSVRVTSGTLPAGLALGYIGSSITLTGTTTATPGIYLVTVEGANGIGISGFKNLKFVIS